MVNQKLIFEVDGYSGSLILETTFGQFKNDKDQEPTTVLVAGTVLVENIDVDRCLEEIWVLHNCSMRLDIEVHHINKDDHRYDYLNTSPTNYPAPGEPKSV